MVKKMFFLILAALLVLGFTSLAGAEEPASGANVGQRPVTNTFTALGGGEVTLPLSDGNITVINLWATWCPPCRDEMPELETFYQNNKDKVKFYAINSGETTGKIEEFMTAHKYSLPVLLDKNGAGGKMLRTMGIPTTVVLDRKGVVVFRMPGAVTAQELETAVNSIK